MAQRMIHYLIGTMLADRYDVPGRKRFLLGSILPDAYVDVKDRDVTHFVSKNDPAVRFYDFERFRAEYRDHMQDGLYLGYYMHLAEDDFYRRLIRKDHDLRVYDDPEGVKKLHRDYRILNSYIAEKWQLQNELDAVPDPADEVVLQIADFDFPGFADEFRHDFTDIIHGETVFLTEAILEEFLQKYVPEIERELKAVLEGKTYLRAESFAWRRG